MTEPKPKSLIGRLNEVPKGDHTFDAPKTFPDVDDHYFDRFEDYLQDQGLTKVTLEKMVEAMNHAGTELGNKATEKEYFDAAARYASAKWGNEIL